MCGGGDGEKLMLKEFIKGPLVFQSGEHNSETTSSHVKEHVRLK